MEPKLLPNLNLEQVELKLHLLILSILTGGLLSVIPIKLGLYSYMVLAIFFDLITGLIKSYVNKIPITSSGYRRTVGKILQYAGVILLGLMLQESAVHTQVEWIEPGVLTLFNKSLVCFIILIEATSILENLLEASPNSKFSELIIKPLHALITFSFKRYIEGNLKDRENNKPKDQ